ncbi:MAG: type 1 glutamine amidotransferase-like domain-containing protein [Nitrospirae bacterium]|nr:type 1 glutamine amidotransferase-like domain-containing protein [Nitrospirota bacterium]
MSGSIQRIGDQGWLVLLGGGEFSFGETLELDKIWVSKLAEGPVGFLPTASGSTDYAANFSLYMQESFGREVTRIPIYRPRDARRQKNVERIEQASAIYIGGGITDQLVETLEGSPALEALGRRLSSGGLVVAIAAATQAFGMLVRSLVGRDFLPGFGWLPDGVVEPNFDPGHDRRLRELMSQEGVQWGLGLPAGSAVLLGPGEQQEILGPVFGLEDSDGDLRILQGQSTEEG